MRDRNNQYEQWKQGKEDWAAMKSVGADLDKVIFDLWERRFSPLRNGKIAAKSNQRWQNMMEARLIAAEILKSRASSRPEVPPEMAILEGFDYNTNKPIVRHIDTWTMPTAIVGPTGSGKTTKAIGALDQFVRRNIRALVIDHRKEMDLISYRYPNSLVVRLDQYLINWLEPVGDRKNFFSGALQHISKFATTVHGGTAAEMVNLMLRVDRGLKPGDPHPSPKDIEKLLFLEGTRTKRPQLITGFHAMAQFNTLLGRAAYVRKAAPELELESLVTVLDISWLDPRFYRAVYNLLLNKLRASQGEAGHNNKLHTLFIVDEGKYLCSREFSGAAGSLYMEPSTILFTQSRAFGIGPIIGIQSISDADENLLSNQATLISLGTPNPKEARLQQEIFQLDSPEQLMHLPKGVGWIRSIGFPHAIKFRFRNLGLGNYMSEAQLAAHQADKLRRIEANTVFSPKDQDVDPLPYLEALGERGEVTGRVETAPESPASEAPSLFEEHFACLKEIQLHPDASLSEHQRSLGWRYAHFDRIKSELDGQGLIIVGREENTGGRPKQILELTEKGRRILEEYNHAPNT